jgi:hypothetical protein
MKLKLENETSEKLKQCLSTGMRNKNATSLLGERSHFLSLPVKPFINSTSTRKLWMEK